jgi:hypothetical protein
LLLLTAASVAISNPLTVVLPTITENSSILQLRGDNSTSTSSANAAEHLEETSTNEMQAALAQRITQRQQLQQHH